MRFNLKNRPQFISEKYGKLIQKVGKEEAFRLYSLETDKWFGMFEKELREKLELADSTWRNHCFPDKDRFESKGEHEVIKEVLGDAV